MLCPIGGVRSFVSASLCCGHAAASRPALRDYLRSSIWLWIRGCQRGPYGDTVTPLTPHIKSVEGTLSTLPDERAERAVSLDLCGHAEQYVEENKRDRSFNRRDMPLCIEPSPLPLAPPRAAICRISSPCWRCQLRRGGMQQPGMQQTGARGVSILRRVAHRDPSAIRDEQRATAKLVLAPALTLALARP